MAPPWNRIFGKPKRVTTLVLSKWEFTLRGHYWPISNVNFVVFSAPESPRRKRWNSIGQFKILNSWVGADAESWLDWFEVLCRAWTLRQLSDWFDLKLSPELGRTGRRLIGWFARFCSSLGRACVSLILIDLQSVFFFPNAHTVKEKVSSGLTVIVEASFGDMTLYGSKLFRTNYSMFFCPSYCLFYILPMKKSLYDNKNVGPLSAVERFLSEQCTYVSEQCTSKYISISYYCKAAYLSYVYRLICVRLEQYVYWTLIFYPDNFTLILKWDQIRSKNGGMEEGELEKDQKLYNVQIYIWIHLGLHVTSNER